MPEDAKREPFPNAAEGPDLQGETPWPEEVERSGFNLGWGKLIALMAWGFMVLAFAAGGLADVTSLWWLVLIFGAAVPILFIAVQNRSQRARGEAPLDRARRGERELLDVLKARGELTPASAAMLTTLTADGASGALESLARKGHLEAQVRDGALVYALRERDRRSPEEPPADRPQPPGEPLSGRELEVLGLMALGRTNAEISRELFVAVGTVKAHANNIYRKLDANNRSEAVSKARGLGLLQ